MTEKDAYVEGLPASEQGAWSYAYDGAGRMTASTDPSGETTTYGWDGGGNRTSVKVGTAPAEVTTYDAAGLPASATGGITYTHDEAGNLIGIDRPGDTDDLALDYDAWGRTTLQVPGTSDPASFELDALDRVVARTQGTTETAYVYAGEGESLAKVSLTGAAETLFAHAPSGPLAQQVGTGDARLLITDLHTDVVSLADPSGTAQGARSFSPWGEVRESGMDSVLGYQGDLTDPGSGLVDMGTRLYAPSLGRFTARDVLFGDPERPLTLNQYAYTSGSPIRYTDPTGMGQTDGAGRIKQYTDKPQAIGGTGGSPSPGVTDPWVTPGYEPVRPSGPPTLLADPKVLAPTVIPLLIPQDTKVTDPGCGFLWKRCIASGLSKAGRVAGSVAGATYRFGKRWLWNCAGDPVCAVSYYGTVSLSLCALVCFDISTSRTNGRHRGSFGISYAFSAGGSLTFAPGGEAKASLVNRGLGCYVGCFGYERDALTGESQFLTGLGLGIRGRVFGGGGGTAGAWSWDYGPAE